MKNKEQEIEFEIERLTKEYRKKKKPLEEERDKIESKKRYKKNKKHVGKIYFTKYRDSLSNEKSLYIIKSIDEEGYLTSISINLKEYKYERENYHSRYKKISPKEAKEILHEALK